MRLKEIIREEVRRHLFESRFPPKAFDYNKIKNADDFWHWKVDDAARESGLRSLDYVKNIGDVIFWLNNAFVTFKEKYGR